MAVKVITYLYCCDDDFGISEFEPSITESLAYRSNAEQVESLIAAGQKLQAYRMGETEQLDDEDFDGESPYHDELDELNDINARIRMRKAAEASNVAQATVNTSDDGKSPDGDSKMSDGVADNATPNE